MVVQCALKERMCTALTDHHFTQRSRDMNNLKLAAARVAACVALAGLANAQVFNVDCNVDPSVAPPSTYEGFSGPAGFWNELPSSGTVPLRLLSGMVDPNVSATMTNLFDQPLQTIPSPHTELYQDYFQAGDSGTGTIQVDGLDEGNYSVFVYSYRPLNASTITVESGGFVTGNSIQAPASFSGHQLAWAAPNFNQIGTLLQFDIMVAAGDDLTIRLFSGGKGTSIINGFQLLPKVGSDVCTIQPPNSRGGVPSIFASGTIANGGIVGAANDMTLHLGSLPSGNFQTGAGAIVVFASNSLNSTVMGNCPFQGTRCISEPMVRVLGTNGGAVLSSQAGTVSVPVDLNFISSPLQGNPIDVSPGSTIYFQAIYRDLGVPGVCNGGNTVRWTNAVEIMML